MKQQQYVYVSRHTQKESTVFFYDFLFKMPMNAGKLVIYFVFVFLLFLFAMYATHGQKKAYILNKSIS